jgi:hypothetical protein
VTLPPRIIDQPSSPPCFESYPSSDTDIATNGDYPDQPTFDLGETEPPPTADLDADLDGADVPSSKRYRVRIIFSNQLISCSRFTKVSAFDQWLPHRASFLDWIFMHDGLGTGGGAPLCSKCDVPLGTEASPAILRCIDCFHSAKFCPDCLVESHHQLPFHRIEVRIYFTPRPFVMTYSPSL